MNVYEWEQVPSPARPTPRKLGGQVGTRPRPVAEAVLHLQRLAGNESVNALLHEEPPSVREVVGSGGGSPLDLGLRGLMEGRFGADFTDVRIHPGGRADDSARSIRSSAHDDGSSQEAEVPIGIAPVTVRGQTREVTVEGGCDGLSLHGQTDATFDGGQGRMVNQRVTTGAGCTDCPPGARCLHVTGTLVTTYRATVVTTMPPMPEGLTSCEQRKVSAFLRNVLAPHEREHARRFKTYNGTTRNPVDLTGCGQDDIQSQIDAIQAAEDARRQANANGLSAGIDPFVRTIDCSDCEGA